MQVSSVPMSGPGMYPVRFAMPRAKCRTRASLFGDLGSAMMQDFPPPWERPAIAFFQVMPRARRNTSSVVTSGAIRIPPMAGPAAVLSTTAMPLSPMPGSVM